MKRQHGNRRSSQIDVNRCNNDNGLVCHGAILKFMHHGEQLSSACRDDTNKAAAAAATMVTLNAGTIAQHQLQSSQWTTRLRWGSPVTTVRPYFATICYVCVIFVGLLIIGVTRGWLQAIPPKNPRFQGTNASKMHLQCPLQEKFLATPMLLNPCPICIKW